RKPGRLKGVSRLRKAGFALSGIILKLRVLNKQEIAAACATQVGQLLFRRQVRFGEAVEGLERLPAALPVPGEEPVADAVAYRKVGQMIAINGSKGYPAGLQITKQGKVVQHLCRRVPAIAQRLQVAGKGVMAVQQAVYAYAVQVHGYKAA